MKGDGEMETSLRHFYRRGTDALALAFSILANLVLVAAVLTTAFSLMTANAHAEIAVSRAATAKAPPLNDGLPEPGFTVTAGDTAIVITVAGAIVVVAGAAAAAAADVHPIVPIVLKWSAEISSTVTSRSVRI